MQKTTFFSTCCIMHPNAKKNDLDHFCIDCCRSLCSNCLPAHMRHKHVKIRRYIYSDVINQKDLRKLFDCSGIQTYYTNKAKVVFMKQRPYQQQQQKNNLRDQYRFQPYIVIRLMRKMET
ncbi:protein RGF1 INDUCIBLE TRANSCRIPTION FACTOR 1-like isoform X2 [Corylus avellana]|uniref:protein RGF1 INDUCIBLE TRANSCRIPTION FACTOR 1-like isoform X2 n=1 Tax=Corylus avellana TaxID=13451 RepID=UPI00286D1969|nr:protein RGF1 INDUCIBLE TRANSCRIPTION FACTOR 1-like isoform X2 [Corylus avellana]